MDNRFKKIFFTLVAVCILAAGFFVAQKSLAASIDLSFLGMTGLGTASLTVLIGQIIQIFLGLLGVIAIGLVLYAGFLWMTAAGNEEKITKAKKILINGVIGLVIILSAYIITAFVISKLVEVTGPGTEPGIEPQGPPGPGGEGGFAVQWFSPQGGDNSLCTIMQAGFNENLVPTSTVNNFSLTCVSSGCNGQDIPGVISVPDINQGGQWVPGPVLVFDPIDDLPANATFQAIIRGGLSGVVSVNSHHLYTDFSWNFSTNNISDITPPKVAFDSTQGYHIYPQDIAANVCLNTPIQAEFNEPMMVSSLVTSTSLDLFVGPGNGQLYSDGFSITVLSPTMFSFSPIQSLSANSHYRPLLNSGVITDTCGNHLDGNGSGQYISGGEDDFAPPPINTAPDWAFNTGTTLECTPLINDVVPTDNNYYDENYLTINGSNFTNAGEVKFFDNIYTYNQNYCFNAASSFPQAPEATCLVSWSPSQIKMKLPAQGGGTNGTIDGPVQVVIPGNGSDLVSNQIQIAIKSPHVSGLSPASGGAAQFVSVGGTNFGASQGTGQVIFWKTIAPGQIEQHEASYPCGPVGWQNNNIVVAVPNGLSQGDWQIQVKAVTAQGTHWSNLETFTVNNNPPGPGLCSINPNNGVLNAPITLQGLNFGTTAGQVLFGNINALIENNGWGNDTIQATVPNVSPATVGVSVKDSNNNYSNSVPFTVNAQSTNALHINYINPTTGPINQFVTIYGSGFGARQTGDTVYFVLPGGANVEGNFQFPQACGTNYWMDTQIIVKVPSGLPLTPVAVVVHKGSNNSNNDVTFTYNPNLPLTPGICSLNPNQGTINPPTAVEIVGEAFSGASVTFSNIPNAPINQSPAPTNNFLSVNVPAGAITGEVKVIKNGQASNPVNFQVIPGNLPPGNLEHYDWQFTTCDNCLIPEIDFNFSCAENLASPSPYPMTQDHSNNINFAVKFTTDMDNGSFTWGQNQSNTVRLKQCQTDANNNPINCISPSPAINLHPIGYNSNGFTFNDNNEGEQVIINLANSLLPVTWYKVELSGNLLSEDGLELYNGAGYNNWYFKTQAVGLQCTVNNAVISPVLADREINQVVGYLSSAYNTNNCDLCDQSDYEWDWSIPDNYINPSSPSYYVASLLNPTATSTQNSVHTNAVTNNGPVHIQAVTSYISTSSVVVNLTAQSTLNIIDNGGVGDSCDLSQAPDCQPDPTYCDPGLYCEPSSCLCAQSPYPIVIEKGPDCGTACGNTAIFAKFDRPMDNSTLNNASIDVLPCTNSACTTFGNEILYSSFQYDQAKHQINIAPLNNLYSQTGLNKYRVILKDGIMSDPSNPPAAHLGNLNYQTPGSPAVNAYSWTFGVVDANCGVDHVLVSPADKIFTSVSPYGNYEQFYTSYAYPIANCQTPLNPANLNWSWGSDNFYTASVQQSNPDWTATTTALHEGNTYMRATVNQSGSNITNQNPNGFVLVSLMGPAVINQCENNIMSPSPEPNQQEVCVNAAITVRFNQPMELQTFDNIYAKTCGTGQNPGPCTGNVQGPGSKTYLYNSSQEVNGFVYMIGGDMQTNTWYQITIPTTVTNLQGLGLDQDYVWYFQTKNNNSYCDPQSVVVNPAELIMSLNTTANYTAYAQSASCELVLGNSYNWTWASANPAIATIVGDPSQNNVTTTQKIVQSAATLNGGAVAETNISATIINIQPNISSQGHLIVASQPNIEQPTTPPSGMQDVCPNAAVSATFNQLMDHAILNGNTIKVQKEIILSASMAQSLGCTWSRAGGQSGITFNDLAPNRLAKLFLGANNFIKNLTLALFKRDFKILNTVLADSPGGDYYWCPAAGNLSLSDQNNKTTFNFSQASILDAGTNYKIKVSGGPSGVKSIYNMPMLGDYDTWTFKTAVDVCTLNYVRVYANYVSESLNTGDWLFVTNVDDPGDNNESATSTYDTLYDADKAYTAKAYNVAGQIIATSTFYSWEWSWESDNTVIATVNNSNKTRQRVIAQNQNGSATISATASTTVINIPGLQVSGMKRTGTANAEVDICENSWIDPQNNYSPPGQNYSYVNGYFQDNSTNFKLKYCRDAGGSGTGDDLPTLEYLNPIVHPANGYYPISSPSSTDVLLKEYIFWVHDYNSPTNLNAVLGTPPINYQPVNISWTGVQASSTVTYTLQRSTSALFPFGATEFAGIPVTSYLDHITRMSNMTVNYYYRVKAVFTNPSGESAWSNIDSVTIGPTINN